MVLDAGMGIDMEERAPFVAEATSSHCNESLSFKDFAMDSTWPLAGFHSTICGGASLPEVSKTGAPDLRTASCQSRTPMRLDAASFIGMEGGDALSSRKRSCTMGCSRSACDESSTRRFSSKPSAYSVLDGFCGVLLVVKIRRSLS